MSTAINAMTWNNSSLRLWASTAPANVILLAVLIHGLMFIYDVRTGFGAFLNADRALSRYENVLQLAQINSWADAKEFVATSPPFGDFALQGLLFNGFGEAGVVLFQIVLQLLSVFAIYRIALLVFESRHWSVAVAIVYAGLPHSLVFAHQLSSEALAVPLVVIGFALFFEYRIAKAKLIVLFGAALTLGIATLVRPPLALTPLVMLPFVFRSVSLKEMPVGLSFVATALAPLFLWVLFLFGQTGQISLGNTNADLGSNLYQRIKIAVRNVPDDEREALSDRYLASAENERVSFSSYLSYVVERPDLYLEQVSRDAIVFITKSGINRITIDYLSLAGDRRKIVAPSSGGWRGVWEDKGLFAMVQMLLAGNPVIVILALCGSAVFTPIFLAATFASARSFMCAIKTKFRSNVDIVLVMLALYVVYIFAVSLLVNAVQSRHRFPAEFALSILCMYSVRHAVVWWQTKKSSLSDALVAHRPAMDPQELKLSKESENALS